VCLAFAPAPFPKAGRQRGGGHELERLQGDWSVLRTTIDGREFPPNEQMLTVRGRTLVYHASGRATTRWEIEVDPAKEPKELDYRGRRGDVVLLIYCLRGDELTICWRNDDNAKGRPVDFRGGDGLGVYILKRTNR